MYNRATINGTHLYYGLAGLIFCVALSYGMLQFKQIRDQKAAAADNQTVSVALEQKLTKLNDYYTRFAASQTDVQAQLNNSLNEILPVGENYTDLTRSFDNFFAAHDSAVNPIVQNSLRFGKSDKIDGMPTISGLPITMNIEGTRDNFFAFLDFIDHSGTLTSHDRLIAINSIQINFPDGGEVLNNQHQVINVTLDMTAYFRNK